MGSVIEKSYKDAGPQSLVFKNVLGVGGDSTEMTGANSRNHTQMKGGSRYKPTNSFMKNPPHN